MIARAHACRPKAKSTPVCLPLRGTTCAIYCAAIAAMLKFPAPLAASGARAVTVIRNCAVKPRRIPSPHPGARSKCRISVADVAIAIEQITGLILAGGQGSRMEHRDKGLQPFLGKPLVAHSIARLAPQVKILAINANRHTDDYAAFGLPLWPDLLTGFAGPLAVCIAVSPTAAPN